MPSDKKTLRVKKQVRIYIYLAFTVAILICCALLAKEVVFRAEKEVVKESNLFIHKPHINYTVDLKPNPIYAELRQPETDFYVGGIIDKINIGIQSEIVGQAATKIKGAYVIRASIIGNNGEGENIQKVWEKIIPLAPKKQFEETKDNVKVSENITIDYTTYNSFIDQLNKDLQLNTSNILKIEMDIQYAIETDHGIKEQAYKPGVTIPLGSSFVQITKDNVKNENIKTETMVKEKTPLNMVQVIILLLLLIIVVVLFILFKLKVKEPTESDLAEIRIRKIINEHGNRLVAIEGEIPNRNNNIIYIHSMADLIKLSDEIERPIFYYYSNQTKEINEFFVMYDTTCYSFRVDGAWESKE